MNLEEKVLKTIIKYSLIEEKDKIVVAVSGGPDSMALLNVLKEINNKNWEKKEDYLSNFEIIVAHVNHMIRTESIDDEKYVREYCKNNGIEFYSKSIDVKKIANTNKIGMEEAGRNVRYEFFDEVMKKTNSNKITIAHNKNDKVETIFMNILRGSGLSGLKGIEYKNDIYIRPLIDCERVEIEKYCKEKNLNPRIDKSNFENIYTRNKIRNICIPYIKQEFNPNIVESISRLSEIVTEEEEYINNHVEKVFEEIVVNINKVEKYKNYIEDKNEIVLNLREFNSQEKVIKSKLILYTITRLFGTTAGIEKIHIDDIIKLCENNIGNKYLTPNKKLKVLVKNHKIYFSTL